MGRQFLVTVYLAIWVCPALALGCPFEEPVRQAAEQAGLPPETIVAIMYAESSCRPHVVGAGGERGLFQFTESTWKRYTTKEWSRAFVGQDNLEVAIKHLKAARTTNPKNLVAWHNAGVRDWTQLNPKWTVRHPNRIYRSIYRGENLQ